MGILTHLHQKCVLQLRQEKNMTMTAAVTSSIGYITIQVMAMAKDYAFV